MTGARGLTIPRVSRCLGLKRVVLATANDGPAGDLMVMTGVRTVATTGSTEGDVRTVTNTQAPEGFFFLVPQPSSEVSAGKREPARPHLCAARDQAQLRPEPCIPAADR